MPGWNEKHSSRERNKPKQWLKESIQTNANTSTKKRITEQTSDPHPQPGRGNTKHLEFAGLSVLTLNEDTAGFEKDD